MPIPPCPPRPHRAGGRGLLVVLCALSACGSPTDDGSDDPPVLSVSSVTEALSAVFEGPDPEAVAIEVTNTGGGSLTGLEASVSYATGQPTNWLAADLSGSTAPATLALEVDLTYLPLGSFDATVEMSADGVGSTESITVTLDVQLSAAPTIEITSMDRAAMLQEGTLEESDVQVTGMACHDTEPIHLLVVDGQSLPLSGDNLCEPFSVTQSSRWGLSTVKVRAVNALGRSAEVVQSYLRSPTYYPVALEQDPTASVMHGAYARLNQPVIDDFVRGTFANPDIDDLATLAWLAIADTDFNGEIPTLITRSPSNAGSNTTYDCVLFTRTNRVTGFRVTRGTLNHVRPALSGLDATDSGLSMYGSMGVGGSAGTAFVAPLTAQGWYDGGCFLPNVSHTVTGSVSATAVEVWGDWDASIDADGDATVTPTDFVIEFDNLLVDLDWGAFFDYLGIGDLTNQVVNAVIAPFESGVEAALSTAVQEQMTITLEEFIEGFTVPQPEALSGATTQGEARLDFIDFDGPVGSGNLELGLATQSWPMATPGPATERGAVQSSGSVPVFSALQYDLALAMNDDLLNQFLWSAWQGGAFAVEDLEGPAGVDYPGIEDADMEPRLPPVVMPGAGSHMVDVGWGDMAVTAMVDPAEYGLPGAQTGDPVPVEMFASGIVALNVFLDEEVYRLDVEHVTASIDIEVVTDEPLDTEALANDMETALANVLTGHLVPTAFSALAVPEIDTDALPSIPNGKRIRIAETTVERNGHYLVIAGSVQDD